MTKDLGTSDVALDLFAGTGWGVACQRLGVEEHGVEIMPEAVDSRDTAGMTTIHRDVWTLPQQPTPDVLIASPPCQTFSKAGRGTGRQALGQVIGLVQSSAHLDLATLREASAGLGDDRTGLVLAPLHYALALMPRAVVWEQVPPALPVWLACADVLRAAGYSVWVGDLRAEQYGVPQTRTRAYLIARRDGVQAAPPEPTHSRYYPRDPLRLSPGVRPWVSIADALPHRSGWDYRGGSQERSTVRSSLLPAPTILFSGGKTRGTWTRPDGRSSERVTVNEAAQLQGYPSWFPFCGSLPRQYAQVGNAVPPPVAHAVLRSLGR